MHHYSEAELERYRTGKMNFFLRTICKLHLWNCAVCKAVLERLEEDELLIADLKQTLSENQTGGNEETYRKLCHHFQSAKDSTL